MIGLHRLFILFPFLGYPFEIVECHLAGFDHFKMLERPLQRGNVFGVLFFPRMSIFDGSDVGKLESLSNLDDHECESSAGGSPSA